jgi:hypothetical protein
MPRTSWPFQIPRQTTPSSIMAPASEPASGLVRPKAGTSRPSARRGSQWSRWPCVPNFMISSPGPSELGTIAVTAAEAERVAILRTISAWPKAEKPRPPYSLGMIMPKNFWLFR